MLMESIKGKITYSRNPKEQERRKEGTEWTGKIERG